MDYVVALTGFFSVCVFVVAISSLVETCVDYFQKKRYVNEYVRIQTSLERREYDFLVRIVTRNTKSDFKKNYRRRFVLYDKYVESRYVKNVVNSHTSKMRRELDRSERKMRYIALQKYNDEKRLREFAEG